MVKFVNGMGGVMLVADERADEYKAMGYKLVASEVGSEKPTKKAPRKTTAKEK